MAAYWVFVRIPAIIRRKREQPFAEKERLKLIGELPLFLSVAFWLLAIYFVIQQTLDLWSWSAGMGLFIFGAAFNEWARSTLGRQWSGAARIIKGHRLITVGPYSVVRHPMYFANIVMLLGGLFVVWSYFLFGIFVLLLVVLLYRASVEEEELLAKFDKEYERYRKRVALIVPFVY